MYTNYGDGLGTAVLAFMGAFAGIFVILGVVMLISAWKLFVKAGKPGWAAIVPIYNAVVLLEIIGRPVWWLALLFASIIPTVGWIIAMLAGIVIAIDTARAFGKEDMFALLLILVPVVGYPMLAFGSAKYVGPNPVKLPIDALNTPRK